MYRMVVKIPSPPFYFEEIFEFASYHDSERFLQMARDINVQIVSDDEIVPMTPEQAIKICRALIDLKFD